MSTQMRVNHALRRTAAALASSTFQIMWAAMVAADLAFPAAA